MSDGPIDENLTMPAYAQLNGRMDAAPIQRLYREPDAIDGRGVDTHVLRLDLGFAAHRSHRVQGRRHPAGCDERQAHGLSYIKQYGREIEKRKLETGDWTICRFGSPPFGLLFHIFCPSGPGAGRPFHRWLPV